MAYKFLRVPQMVNGVQEIEKFNTYDEALEYATSGDSIYKLIEVVE